MRVLYVQNGNGLNPGLGGSLVRTAEVARRVAEAGHEVHIMTTSGGQEALRRLGIQGPFHIVRASLFAKRERFSWQRYTAYLWAAMFGPRVGRSIPPPDVVVSDSDYICDVAPARSVQTHTGARWIATVHHLTATADPAAPSGMAARLRRRWQQRSLGEIARAADLALLYATPAGDAVEQALVRGGMEARRIRRMHNGFDPKSVAAPAPKEPEYDACLLGGLRPGKGMDDVVPIWAEVVKARPEARLVAVGPMQPHHERQLRARLDEAGLARLVDLRGGESHDRAMQTLMSAKVFIAPSREEGWGIAVCEALASGRPVVAYDLPVYRALFKDGIASAPLGDSASFARAIVSLLEDPARRARLSTGGRKAVQAYTWDAVARADLAHYEAARAAKPASAGGRA